MDSAVITSAEQIDAAWLTRVLRAAGALRSGTVEAVDRQLSSSVWSTLVWLRVRYDTAAEGDLPAALLLKCCVEGAVQFGRSEVDYYTRDYESGRGGPLPLCYHAAYRERPRAYHLLLEDLSGTHRNGFEIAPTLALGCATADALARLHAHYWGAARLATIGARPAGTRELERYLAHVQPAFDPLFEMLGDGLAPGWHDGLVAILSKHRPAMQARAERGGGCTLLHGDTNPGNILFPVSGSGPVYLIDRQPFAWSLQCWLGASDLARMMVLSWTTEQRCHWQYQVLRQYQTSLERLGIEYPWDELTWDYRFSVAQCVETAIERCLRPAERTAMRWLWEMLLTRSMTAFFDLSCHELL